MKLIIAGGRGYKFTDADITFLDGLRCGMEITEVVSGGCPSGADYHGEQWAHKERIAIKKFIPEWEKYKRPGKRNPAGPIRNRQMAEYADAVVLFPGGRGTESMYNEAKRTGILILDKR